MDMVRFGIIGPGRIAARFAQAFATVSPGAELTAVASSDPKRAKAFARKYRIPFALRSYDELLASSCVDVVYVAVTNNAHFAVCMRVIEAGKHLLCEKPLAMNHEQAAAVFTAARERGVFAMEAMWARFLPAAREVRAWLAQGRIGTPQLADITVSGYRSKAEYPRLFERALGGGSLFDLGVYGLEAVLDYAGVDAAISRVSSSVLRNEQGVDLTAAVGIEFASGFLGLVKSSVTADGDNTAYLYGSTGYIRISPTVNYPAAVSLHQGPRTENGGARLAYFSSEYENGLSFEIDHVARCMREGRTESDIMPPSDTLKCARLFDTVLQLEKK